MQCRRLFSNRRKERNERREKQLAASAEMMNVYGYRHVVFYLSKPVYVLTQRRFFSRDERRKVKMELSLLYNHTDFVLHSTQTGECV